MLDGEIACVDDSGRSVFNDLLFRRRECVFFAFDLLFLNGEDLRALPLNERKARLKTLLRRKRPPVLYADHIEAHGRQLLPKGRPALLPYETCDALTRGPVCYESRT